MAYTRVWDETRPNGATVNSNLIDDEMRFTRVDLRERIAGIFGLSSVQFGADPVAPISLTLSGALVAATVSATFTGNLTGNVTGNASTATALQNARLIGGTSFNGTADIAVALAATATKLVTARTIGGGTAFDGTANVNVALADTATKLATTRAINGVNFDGSAPITITATATNALTFGTHLSGGPYDGSVARTIATDATNINTVSTIVARDVNGDFSARIITATTFSGSLSGNVTGNVTGAVTGNASSATVLQTARAINGVNFDGSAAITITATATNALTFGTHLSGGPYDGSVARTISTDATSGNVGSTIVSRDVNGDFSARIITATTFSGAATTAGTVTTAAQANITSAVNLTSVGALNAGSITSGFGSIDVGADPISTTGTVTGGVVTAPRIYSGASTGNFPAGNAALDTGIPFVNGDAIYITFFLGGTSGYTGGGFVTCSNIVGPAIPAGAWWWNGNWFSTPPTVSVSGGTLHVKSATTDLSNLAVTWSWIRIGSLGTP